MPNIKRVLIADDHSLYRRGLAVFLQDKFTCAEVVEASSFDAASAEMAQGPAFDVALFDLNMPGMDRATSLAALHKQYPDSKIAVVSASERRGDVLDSIAAGLNGFIPKTLPSEEFVRAVEMVIDGKIYVPGLMLEPDNLDLPPVQTKHEVRATNRHAALAKLTPRQREVYECVCQGMSNREIGEELGISIGTVKIHVAALMVVLEAKNRVQLASI